MALIVNKIYILTMLIISDINIFISLKSTNYIKKNKLSKNSSIITKLIRTKY